MPVLLRLLAALAVILVTVTGSPAAAADVGERRAVILIPGYGSTLSTPSGALMESRLVDAGYTVLVAPVGNMTGDLTVAARAVLHQGHGLRAAGFDRVDLVGVSAGGLVGRAAVTMDYANRDRTFGTLVTLGSPLNGHDIASLGPGWECGNLTCVQMRPGSAFMRGLPELPAGRNATPVVSLWTQDDLVVPAAASQLVGALNVHVQAACPGIVGVWTGHEHLITSPAFVDLTMQALVGERPAVSTLGCVLPER